MQLITLISDTYRSLKSRGLFWVMLWISLILGLAYVSLGCNDHGWYLFFGVMNFPSEFLRAGTGWERSLLLTTLDGLLDYWMLTWAVVLAMFPASTIFPDSMRPGAIDLILSKPVTRFKVCFAKYCGALLFVAVQALVLVTICFLSVFLRLNTLQWEMFWTIGLAVLIFSFVFCFNVLMGILTRNSMAALLLTMVFWSTLWLVQKVHTATGDRLANQAVMDANQPDFKTISETVARVHTATGNIMMFLPHTQETAALLRRFTADQAPYSFQQILLGGQGSAVPTQATTHSIQDVITSGLAFQALVLLLAYWRFATLDF